MLLKAALAISVFGSAAIGLGYALFFAGPALRDAIVGGTDPLLPAAHLGAAVLFAGVQVVSGARLLRDRPSFFGWLVPAAVYLFTIGVVGWLGAGQIEALWLDSVRAIWLVALGAAQLRFLRGRAARSRSILSGSRFPP